MATVKISTHHRRLLAEAFLGLALSASCAHEGDAAAHSYWFHPHLPLADASEQVHVDHYRCAKENETVRHSDAVVTASKGVGVGSSSSRASVDEEMYRACMRARGWRRAHIDNLGAQDQDCQLRGDADACVRIAHYHLHSRNDREQARRYYSRACAHGKAFACEKADGGR